MNDNKLALIALISVGILWGFLPIFQKSLLQILTPEELVFSRFMITGLLLLFWVFTL